jgi:choline-sulfatase
MVRSLAGRLAVLALFGSVCVQAQKPATPAVSSSSRPPDVFLITLDTLRADHVECYGYKGVKTPALNRLAADGIRFEQAFTPSPITNTSHASILTGLLPSSHGVADFAVPLRTSTPSITELLHARGYETAAFVSAVILDSKSLAPGFDRGFEFYFNFPSNLPKKSSRYGRVERRAAETINAAQNWLSARKSRRPRFVWVHLYDPHDPYDPPAPYAQEYRSQPYDGEVAYADSQLARFLDFLQQRGLYQNALVIAVGDHGEGLGEHGENTHGIFLYDSTLRVPLIIKLPQARSRGTSVGTQVRTIDIAPTILDLVGIRVMQKFDGESLLPLTGQSTAERVALGETDYPLRFGWAAIKSARAGGHKYIDAPRPELYNLRSDPGETQSVYEPWNPEVQKLRGMVAELRDKAAQKETPNPAAPDPKTIEELKALGYLGNNPGQTTASGPSALPDPKDKIELHNLLHAAMLAEEDGDTVRAQAALNSALQKDPNSSVALLQLGQLELEQKNYRGAAEHLTRAHSLRPEDAAAAFYLGKALYGLGDGKAAQQALEHSLKLSTGQFEARYLLGKIYADMKNWNAAEDQLEAAVFLDARNPEARIELARVLLAKRQPQSALEHLEQARVLSPQQAEVFDVLSATYSALGKRQQAAAAAQRARTLRAKKQGAASGASTQN